MQADIAKALVLAGVEVWISNHRSVEGILGYVQRLGSRVGARRWVSELIGIAGDDDIFPQRALASLGRDRIVADDGAIIAARPDIIVGSWCGKKFRPEKVTERPGWAGIPAVRDGETRDQVAPHPAAWARSADRGSRCTSPDRRQVVDATRVTPPER